MHDFRYLEKYKVKDRRANGSVLAVACKETCESTVRTSSDCLSQEINGILDCKMKGRHELKTDCDHRKSIIETKCEIQCLAHGSKENQNGKKKMNKKRDSGSKNHCEEISYKAETKCKEETDITVKKIRKQSRKRGKKRKKKSENSNIETNQDDI